MDTTLREYLALADSTHEFVDKFGVALKVTDIQDRVTKLHIAIKNIQAVAKRMADVANIVNQVALYKKPESDPTTIDTYPTENDHAVLRTQEPDEKRIVLKDIAIPIRKVATCSEIPINHLYYVEDVKQYAINIAGVVIKGGLANIVPYQTEKSARCQYGVKCNSFVKGKECKYYHDPEDFLSLGLSVPDSIRNYTAGSWLYSKNKRSKKTYFTRHVGNLATMHYDLQMLRRLQYREEVSNREGQLIHDLLIFMVLHNKGMLERYPHWKK